MTENDKAMQRRGDAMRDQELYGGTRTTLTPASDAGAVVEEVGQEQAAWDWLDQMVSGVCDDHPSDILFSANQMVDAFMAGNSLALQSQSAELARLREQVQAGEALPEYGHWLPNVWDAYLHDLDCDQFEGFAKLPATFRWHEFWDRLRTEIEAAHLAQQRDDAPTPSEGGDRD